MKQIRTGKFLLTIVTSFGLISSLFFPSLAFAYSGYGMGTSHDPYLISSCQELQDMNQNLTGYYTLVSNIDCSGFNFSAVGNLAAKFRGQLDGGSHTILNLVPADGSFAIGLFGATDGAVIKNLKLEGGTLSISPLNPYVGGVVGFAQNTTLTNVHSNQTINSNSYGYLGGLVGIIYNNDTIAESSFSGNLSGTNTNSYTGGIAGLINDSASSITNSYTTGTIYPPSGGYSIGGIVGSNFSGGSITNVYSTVTFSAAGINGAGGLIGLDDRNGGRLENSFAAATISGTGANVGAVIGQRYNSTPLVNDYFDQSKGPANCVGSDFSIIAPACAQENYGNSYPNFFKNNTTNGPLSNWDFTTIWQQNASYPILKNEAAFIDPAVPNNGDANNDGMQDSYQANVISQVDPTTGKYVVLESSCAVSYNVQVGGEASGNGKDITYDYPAGLIGFTTFCAPGTTATITEYFYGSFDVSKLVMRNWDGANTYTTIPGATLSNITIAGQPVLKVVYQVTDGGALDNFQPANGVIRMISGPGVSAILPPNTGTGTIQINSAQTLLEYFSAALSMFIVAKMIRRYTK